MNQLKQRVILGLYYQEELYQMNYREVAQLLSSRRKLIRKLLHDPTCTEDPRLWPDYSAIMFFSFRRRLKQLIGPLLKNWDELIEQYPDVRQRYEYALETRNKIHAKKRSRRERRARLATVNFLGKDLRWLGRFEMFIEGKTTYGYPTN